MLFTMTEKVKRGVFYYCSNCGAKVQEDAETCPSCQLVLGGTRYDDPSDMPTDEAKLRRTQRRFAYVILAALLVVLAAIAIIVLVPSG
jgi:uncharacterized membrane protein YvbJ